MDAQALFAELEDLLQRLGVAIKSEKLSTTAPWIKGGLYRMKGKTCCLIDSSAPLGETNDVLLDAVGQLELEGVYIKPAVRELIRPQNLKEGADSAKSEVKQTEKR